MASVSTPLRCGIEREWCRGATGLSRSVVPRRYAHVSGYWPTGTFEVDNIAYHSDVFRKLHLEIARAPGLEVLHCVMYPRDAFDIPIIGIDLVWTSMECSFAIVDASPVSDASYVEDLARKLQAHHDIPRSDRKVPKWGKAIFSDAVILQRAPNVHEPKVSGYAIDLVRGTLAHARGIEPAPWKQRKSIRAAQVSYCTHQLANTKTRAALSMAFGDDFADDYMRDVMFDVRAM